MKNFFKYILTSSIFITQNLFAQSAAETPGMDMSVYATWMGSAFLVMLFIMMGIFLISGDKESAETENIVLHIPAAFGNDRINFTGTGNSVYSFPGLSLELNRIKVLLVSAIISFSLILLLLLIQK